MKNYPELNNKIIKLLQSGKYSQAIRFFKKEVGGSSEDAKIYVDSLARRLNLPNNIKPAKPRIWRKLFLLFIVLNIILFIMCIVSLSFLGSLEYMDSLFGFSEWQVDELGAMLSQKIHLIPLILAIEIFLFFFLSVKSIGKKLSFKAYIAFIIILSIFTMPLYYFIKLDKNRFRHPEAMEKIVKELENKRAFKDQEIKVNYLGFYIGNIDRQSSIYIVGEFDNNRYTYRPYNLIMNWKKDNHQTSTRNDKYIELDKLDIANIVPKIFEFSEKIVKEKNLSFKYKGVNIVQLIDTSVNGKDGWYWRSSIRERGNRITASVYIVFDLNGNPINLPPEFQD